MERTSSRLDFTSEHDDRTRQCDSPGCAGEGLYRAPKSSRQLRDYHWFCLDHVRAYNRSWNFCAGFSEAEIEAMIREALPDARIVCDRFHLVRGADTALDAVRRERQRDARAKRPKGTRRSGTSTSARANRAR